MKKRPYQYSIISLFVLMAVSACVFAYVRQKAAVYAQEARAVAALPLLDIKVKLAEKPTGWGRWLARNCYSIEPVKAVGVGLGARHIHESEMRHLGCMPDLEWIILFGCNFESEGGLRHLSSAKQLRELDLTATSIDDDDLKYLRGLRELRTLNLRMTDISDTGMTEVVRHTKIVELHLLRTRITDTGLKHMGRLPKLKHLDISLTQISDEGVAYLSHCPNLEYLNLGATSITDKSLAVFKNLRNLKKLILTRTNVTDEGVKDLQRALPNLVIRK